MAHTFGKASTRTSSAGNPITTAGFQIVAGETVLVLLLKVNGGTDRAGGAPMFAGLPMTQASTTQKAATSPEASCELWYLIDPPVGTWTCEIPNTGGLTVFYTLATGVAKAGGKSRLAGASGGNGTSANPQPGAVATHADGAIGFAVAANGATDFDPATPQGTGFGTGTGTPLGTFDDGAHGGGQQYHLQSSAGSFDLGWTFATSDDWGAVSVYFDEIPAPVFNNYMGARTDGGMGVTEKIR